jgi:hypothetical protein
MTLTQQPFTASLAAVVDDLYRDIHKGIRAELFGITGATGRLDPSDRGARVDAADWLDRVVYKLVSHAAHEDTHVQPKLVAHLPELAEKIEADHVALESRMDQLKAVAAEAVDAPRAGQRQAVHHLYIELASFTSAYLAHQDVEERIVMPALESAIGVDEVLALHQEIVADIPPAELADGLSIMLSAMNLDDRAEMLGGMREGAPAEVFAGVWGLTGSVLAPDDFAALAARLGIAR